MKAPGSLRRSVRLAIVSGMVTGMVVIGSPAHACDCGPVDLGERLPEVDGAFVGTVVDRETLDQRSVAITFEVERVIKGEFGPRAIVRTDASGASCGLEFLDGPRGGLLLDRASDGVWESSLCQQVGADELLSVAPAASIPEPAVAPVDPRAGPPWWIVGLIGVVTAGGLLLRMRGVAHRPPE
jgi:hypothetical protein